MGDTQLSADDADGWAKVMKGFASHAVGVTMAGMQATA
jgi:hypothetical protein